MLQITRVAFLITSIVLSAGLEAADADTYAWNVTTYEAGTFTLLSRSTQLPLDQQPSCELEGLPASWQVRTALRVDLTGDGVPECALLVWRPWQDWAIMRWSDTPSPIAGNRDQHGDSAHVILVEPAEDDGLPKTEGGQRSTYRELWAGSALAVPIVQFAVGDVDGDGQNELIALEGDYATGRDGPATHLAVWRWNGFGFTLQWRSPPGRFVALALAELDGDAVVEILVR